MHQFPPNTYFSRRWKTNQTAKLLRQSATNRLAYLLQYLARWERLEELDLGMPHSSTRALISTLEEIHRDQTSFRPRISLDSLKALMSSQYLCWTARPDWSHIAHEVQIWDQHREIEWLQALIDCSATSIFISPQPLNRLRLPHEAAHITTHTLDGQVSTHSTESGTMAL